LSCRCGERNQESDENQNEDPDAGPCKDLIHGLEKASLKVMLAVRRVLPKAQNRGTTSYAKICLHWSIR
jgi:hypothetical protein